MKYRKKPVVIDAIQYDGSFDSMQEVSDFTEGQLSWDQQSGKVTINTLEGNMEARQLDYIIKGVSGEFYPCKPDIFLMTYEEA